MTEKMHKALSELFDKGYEVGYKKAKEDFARLHGEWIYHAEWEVDGECPYECSKCGIGSDVDYDFCPGCGWPMTEKALEILRKRERGEEK